MLAPGRWTFESEGRRVLASLSAGRAEGAGLAAEGGAVEIEIGAREAAVTLHGAPGTRRIEGLAGWTADPLLVADGAQWRIEYDGGEPLTVYLAPPGTSAAQLRAKSRSLAAAPAPRPRGQRGQNAVRNSRK